MRATAAPKRDTVERLAAKLTPLHGPMPKPRSGDWLTSHRERGQTFAQYLAEDPFLPRDGHDKIVIQPLGSLTDGQTRVVNRTATFKGIYFGLPVVVEKGLPLSVIPAHARRDHPSRGNEQILTGHVLNQILKERFPENAAVYIAFTGVDLWPGRHWSFVFGEALPGDRVGVWSLYRLGKPDRGERDFRQTLLRSMKVATHEAGHMFGMDHCTAHPCNMCGSNSLEETDRYPLALCPQCIAKLWWLSPSRPRQRFEKLAAFCDEEGLDAESRYFREAAARLADE
jgi:archaemetzincin